VLFLCVWTVEFIGLFHQVWPLLLVPLPRPSSSRARVAQPPKPGTPELCPACRARGEPLSVGECLHVLTRAVPRTWSEVKRRGGRRKKLTVAGASAESVASIVIMDAAIHAIVADEHLGQDGSDSELAVSGVSSTPVPLRYGAVSAEEARERQLRRR
jgi:hypothetical protein